MVTVMDADGMLLGRLASVVAKRSLQGEEIAIVNAEKAIISGTRVRVLANYNQKRHRGSKEGGPFFPRRPDHILKRTIRGMLPYKRQRGDEALKRVKVYVGIPKQFATMEMERPADADMERLGNPRYITLGDVSTFLGAKY
jgi:large subunit ribosomal protein L13